MHCKPIRRMFVLISVRKYSMRRIKLFNLFFIFKFSECDCSDDESDESCGCDDESESCEDDDSCDEESEEGK